METYQAYKVRVYPTKKQVDLIIQFIGNSRFVYNQMLAMHAFISETKEVTDDEQ